MRKLVNIAVCGKFHYLNYVGILNDSEIINNFFFSHKRSTGRGLESGVMRTFNSYPKEYLVQAHLRIFGPRLPWLFYFYEFFWQRAVLRNWSKAKILHFLANGTTASLQIRARLDGSLLLAEAVNTHPLHRINLLKKEASSAGVDASNLIVNDRHLSTIDECWGADGLLVPSEIVRKSFIDYGYTKPIYKIPYAANTSRFQRKSKESYSKTGFLRIICVGEIGLRKGQRYLLEAARNFAGKVHVTLVGRYSYDGHELVKKYQGEFRHLESVQSEKMPELLRQHDVMILPSLEEGLAVSVCEAMASGLAVLTTVEAGGGEIITDDVDGILINSSSAESIDIAIEFLLRDRKEVIRLGTNASLRMSARGSWDKYATDLCKVYSEFEHH